MSTVTDQSNEDFDSGYVEWLADELVDGDVGLLEKLVQFREQSGLDIEDVATRMGVSPVEAAEIETYYADPTLSVLRRYALAVGAHVSHSVLDGEVCYRKSQYSRVSGECTSYKAFGANLEGVFEEQVTFQGRDVEFLYMQRMTYAPAQHVARATVTAEVTDFARV